jgi:hypothetical protein
MDGSKSLDLFDIYARNLAAVKRHPRIHLEPDVSDAFVCPLCFGYFYRTEAEAADPPAVTREHVPPKSLGGRIRTLTCASCNSWAGQEVDSHLVNKLLLDDFLEGISGASVDASIQFEGGAEVTGTLKHSKHNVLQVFCDQERSQPDELARLQHMLDSGLTGFHITFQGFRGRGHVPSRAQCCLLRIAYLWAFSVFGYGFLMDHGLAVLRGQLRNPEKQILPHWGITQRQDIPDEALGINLIIEPPEMRSFFVAFDLVGRARTVRYGVVLPGPSEPGVAVYDHLARTSQDPACAIRMRHIPEDPNFLLDPDLAFASHQIWHHWRLES